MLPLLKEHKQTLSARTLLLPHGRSLFHLFELNIFSHTFPHLILTAASVLRHGYFALFAALALMGGVAKGGIETAETTPSIIFRGGVPAELLLEFALFAGYPTAQQPAPDDTQQPEADKRKK